MVSTKNDVQQALPSLLSTGFIPKSQDKGQELRGTLRVALQERGGLSGLGLGLWPGRVRGGDTPPALDFGGKSFTWG